MASSIRLRGGKTEHKILHEPNQLSTHKGKTALIQYSALNTSRRITHAAKKLAIIDGGRATVFRAPETDT